VALLCAVIVLLAVIGVRAWRRSRVSAEEKERRRRVMLASDGKLGDASLVDINESSLVYSYAVRGVEYTATQDISGLQAFLPGGLASLGHVQVRYDPRNPANSIVLAEDWSGFYSAPPASVHHVASPSPAPPEATENQ